VLKRVTDKTWLQEAAQAAGNTDLKSLAIVYHIQGSSFGDTIDIIDAKTGVTQDTLFGFYFGEAFGRMALTNATGSTVRRLDYVYTKQNDHSLGDALIIKNVTTNKNSARITFQGTMNYLVTPTGTAGLKVCNGTFTVGKEMFFTNSP
jgi:hypothetical protein